MNISTVRLHSEAVQSGCDSKQDEYGVENLPFQLASVTEVWGVVRLTPLADLVEALGIQECKSTSRN